MSTRGRGSKTTNRGGQRSVRVRSSTGKDTQIAPEPLQTETATKLTTADNISVSDSKEGEKAASIPKRDTTQQTNSSVNAASVNDSVARGAENIPCTQEMQSTQQTLDNVNSGNSMRDHGAENVTPSHQTEPSNPSVRSINTTGYVKENVSQNVQMIQSPNINERAKPHDMQTNVNGSRYQTLQSTCRHCDRVCISPEESMYCIKCRCFSHMACEKTEIQILQDLQYRGTFICENCKIRNRREDSTSDLDSSMNSEERYRAEFDAQEEMDIDEEALLREDSSENENQWEIQGKKVLTPQKNQIDGNKTENVQIAGTGSTYNRDELTHSTPKKKQYSSDLKAQGAIPKRLSTLPEVKENETERFNTPLAQSEQSPVTMNMMEKMNELMHIVKGIKEDQTTFQQSIAITLENYDHKKSAEIDKKLSEGIDKIEKTVEQKVDQYMNQNLEKAINDKIKNLEQRIDNTINQKVGTIVNNTVESALDEFDDKLWRQKNILIVNLAESRKENVEDRKEDDMNEVLLIFNKFVRFSREDAEAMPVRLGRIGNRPRILRITLKSETMIRTIVQKARDSNHLLNPTETDNKKKVYINRDYTQKERQERKRKNEELKEKKRVQNPSQSENNMDEIKRRAMPIPSLLGNESNNYDNQRQNGQNVPNLLGNRNDIASNQRNSGTSIPSLMNIGYINRNTDDQRSFGTQSYSHPIPVDQSNPNFNTGISPMNRVDMQDYPSLQIRDDNGRIIRGAESAFSSGRDRNQLGRGREFEQRNDYTEDQRHRRGNNVDDRDYNPNRYEHSRLQRQSSKQPNQYQPGSIPYGAPRFGKR